MFEHLLEVVRVTESGRTTAVGIRGALSVAALEWSELKGASLKLRAAIATHTILTTPSGHGEEILAVILLECH